MTSLAHPRSSAGRVFEHRFLQYRRTFRGVDLHLVPVAGPVPDRDGPRAGAYVSTRVERRARRRALPRLPGARACWPRPRCSPRRSRRPSRSWAGWSGARPSTRCTRRRSRRATSRSATWPGSIARLTLICSIFTLVIVLFGAAQSPLIVLAIPAAVLTGMAFAAPIAAFSATQKTPSKFAAIFRFGITPLFLFSGTFFPIELAAGVAPGAGLADAAVPRRGADPRAVARDARSTIRSRR